MKPPSIILLTPNGRFEVNKKICLSISGHHPESWQPSWSIRTALLAIIAFMPTEGLGAIGSLDYTEEERIKLARQSQSWQCKDCGLVCKLLKEPTARAKSQEELDVNNRELERVRQICFTVSPLHPLLESNISCSQNSPSESKETSERRDETSERRDETSERRDETSKPSNLRRSDQQQNRVVVNKSGTDYINSIIVGIIAILGFLIFRRLFLVTTD